MWSELEKLALTEPVIHAALTRRRQGVLSDEEALLVMVLALAKVKNKLAEDLLHHVTHCNAQHWKS
jgi:hypothetical protein